MNTIAKELKYLVLWLLAGVILLPLFFWWLGTLGVAVLPGMEDDGLRATYAYFVRHLNELLVLAILFIPYLMFIVARLLQEKPALADAAEVGLAVSRGEPAEVRQLIEQGRDVNRGNSAGETPLHLAAMRGDMGMAWLLLDGGADFNATDDTLGYTPLQIAALRGHAEICEALIRYGASVDTQTSRQETALHLAARDGHAGVVAVLLKYRAATGLQNSDGLTARQLAERNGHVGVVDMMIQHATAEWPYLRMSSG